MFNFRSPIGWMLGLSAFGKKLAETRASNGDILWSNNYQYISYKQFEYMLSNFRGVIVTLLKRHMIHFRGIIVTLLKRHMINFRVSLIPDSEKIEKIVPAIHLFTIYIIKDNLRNATMGWSFLLDERNKHVFNRSI